MPKPYKKSESCLRLVLFLPVFVAMFALTMPGLARAEALVITGHAESTLLSDHTVAAPGDRVTLALHQDLMRGWHVYWRNPGDSGDAPRFIWDLPEGTVIGDTQWPVPERIALPPLVSYGYEDEVAFLHALTLPADWPAGEDFRINLVASWLICEEICVPEEGAFSIVIPTGEDSLPVSGADADVFARAHAAQPQAEILQAVFSGDADSPLLVVENQAFQDMDLADAYFFPARWGVIDHAAMQRFTHEGTRISLSLTRGDMPLNMDGEEGILLLEGEVDNIAFSIEPAGAEYTAMTTGSMTRDDGGGFSALLAILAGALLGGMILNLMPCVFPVLAIKAAALADHGEGDDHALRMSRMAGGMAYLAGVLTCFFILGGALLALQAAGAAIGWGFQLQNPVVVALLVFVLLVVGLNLSGVFEIRALRLSNAGQGLTQKKGHAGSYFTGLLAAVVATPCTAPFMGVAMGAALTQSAPVAMAAFLALGLGLALPYVVLTMLPPRWHFMPRPGPWLGSFKQFLAFPMYLSAAYLLWVLMQQVTAQDVLMVMVGAVLIAFAAWLYGLSQSRPGAAGAKRIMTALVMLASLFMGLAMAARLETAAPDMSVTGSAAGAEVAWEVFSQERIDALQAEGRPVFVNLTAAWCITCKFNERNVLSGQAFASLLEEGSITYLKGDWTNRDTAITAYLQQFDRAGVPLYVFYDAAGEVEILPQILTEARVRESLSMAQN